jgi:Fe(3+) dicitrate transport protein
MHFLCLCTGFGKPLLAQEIVIKGKVINQDGFSVAGALVQAQALSVQTNTDSAGQFLIKTTIAKFTIEILATGYHKERVKVDLSSVPNHNIVVVLQPLQQQLTDVTITGNNEKTNGISRLKSVDGFGIYEAKKTELIVISDLHANLATNNARQVFGKIPGLNIWESDAAGLQLGIGGRGLNPNRTSNFNTRQNGYDISADALGYPETYYTPPAEALERIEVVRGAAALQYGTQFGGLVNFVFKKGPANKKIEVVSRQTGGSYGFLGTFNSIGGTIAKNKLNYYAFYSAKKADGWRQNSGFWVQTAHTGLQYKLHSRVTLLADYTHMTYNAQQPGGLTDAQFLNNPQQSFRNRNWFKVNWNLFSFSVNYDITDNTRLNIRNFGIASSRLSLGNLERINVIDFGGNRTLIIGNFMNWGNETRLLQQYRFFNKAHTLLVGTRAYYGTTVSKQGDGDNGSSANYRFLNPDNLENSDYTFTNKNLAAFAENIFRISPKLSITPGLRYEYISTAAAGFYRITSKDAAGNIVGDTSMVGSNSNTRTFMLAGLGFSFKLNPRWELYTNISQNYRAINFNDLRIVNPNFVVDANMKDESGYSADLGLRGGKGTLFNVDATLFLLKYNDRIGNVLRADRPPLFLDYRFRTNIADSRNTGVECFAEVDIWQLFSKKQTLHALVLFGNWAYVDARYINTGNKAIANKQVEMAPRLMLRNGVTYKYKSFGVTYQSNYVSEHFTDATNARIVAGAVNGIIPAYWVSDISVHYHYKHFIAETTCNNLFNAMYFTRRADAYPGPGIIPSDARSFFVTVGVRW